MHQALGGIMVTQKKDMTLERFREIWEIPYGQGKKPDYSRIYPYYHPDCRFQDSVQAFQGKDKFVQMCDRLQKRCSELYMDVHAMAKNGNIFFVQWTMTMRFRRTPLTPLQGATRVTVDDAGLITEQRDYYDLWGDSLDAIPVMGKMYRWFMKTVMG
jgi:hypothetical protein